MPLAMEPLVRPLPRERIHANDTALLVIDMERDFVDAGAVQETPGGRAIVPAINRLIAWARRIIHPSSSRTKCIAPIMPTTASNSSSIRCIASRARRVAN